MRRAKAVVLLFLLLGLASSCRKFEVRISSPEENTAVPDQSVVQGTVSNARAEVWVVVHPIEVPDQYWVQPEVTLKGDGTWTAQIYVGDPGAEDVGKKFLLMAVANPKEAFEAGDVLTGWPAAAAQSEIVAVTRE